MKYLLVIIFLLPINSFSQNFIINKDAIFRISPSTKDKPAFFSKDTSTVTLLRYVGDFYYQVKYQEKEYYLSEIEFANEKAIIKHRESFEKIEEEKQRKESDKAAKVFLASLHKKYGVHIGNKIAIGDLWIGMSKSQALDSQGDPLQINKTVDAKGRHDEWVYSRQILFFDNDKLTSYKSY